MDLIIGSSIGLYSILPNYITTDIININSDYTLDKDGFEIYKIDVNDYKNNQKGILKAFLQLLPIDYKFLDYEYKIINSTLYTFHRDVTSSQSFQKLKYPSYTLIIYFTTGDLLSISPNSYKQRYLISKPVTITGVPGTCILFNSDNVHAGAMNDTSKRTAVQYKICHKDDLYKLQHLNNQYIIKEDKIRNFTLLDKYLCRMSHKYISIFDSDLGNIIERKTNNKFINFITKKIKVDFYNKT